jgi:hypothetical protein
MGAMRREAALPFAGAAKGVPACRFCSTRPAMGAGLSRQTERRQRQRKRLLRLGTLYTR